MKLLFVSQALIQLRKPKLQKPNAPNLHDIKQYSKSDICSKLEANSFWSMQIYNCLI